MMQRAHVVGDEVHLYHSVREYLSEKEWDVIESIYEAGYTPGEYPLKESWIPIEDASLGWTYAALVLHNFNEDFGHGHVPLIFRDILKTFGQIFKNELENERDNRSYTLDRSGPPMCISILDDRYYTAYNALQHSKPDVWLDIYTGRTVSAQDVPKTFSKSTIINLFTIFSNFVPRVEFSNDDSDTGDVK